MKRSFENDKVKHVKCGDIEYLKFKALEQFEDKIDCKVFLKHGGVSEGVFGSLNVKTWGDDSRENVIENAKRIAKFFDIDSKCVCKGAQAHTDNIIYLNENNMDDYAFYKINQEEVDGYVTDSNKLATMVITADCNAIIMYDTVNNVVANVHCGWKGVIKRIHINALNIMKEKFNTNPGNVIVCVSPAIEACCFSSEEQEFKNKFTDLWEDEENYIYYEKDNYKRFHIDMSYLITKDLKNAGVKEENIHFAKICTCCNHDNFFSYRYKTMHNEQDYGCFATVVKLK